MTDYNLIRAKFEGRKIYTYSEALNLICKGQSSTASYIMNDMLASGMIVRVLHPVLSCNGYRINQ